MTAPAPHKANPGAGRPAGCTPAAGGSTNPKQKRSGYARDPHDWYVEPARCTELLLGEIIFSGTIFDPACGCGSILTVAQCFGFHALGCDIVDRGWPGMMAPRDFLKRGAVRIRPANIITNPPYKLAEAFARRALELARLKVAVLARLDFLASQRRNALFTEHPPAYVLVLSRRPSMPPGELLMNGEVRATSGQHDYCWVVWSPGEAIANTVIRWLI